MNNNVSRVTDGEKAILRKVEEAKLDFALDLVRLIEASGLTQQELAEKAGVKAPYISRVLRGDENLTIASMVKIANAAEAKLNIHLSNVDCTVRWLEMYDAASRQLQHMEDVARTWARSDARNGKTFEVSFKAANEYYETESAAA